MAEINELDFICCEMTHDHLALSTKLVQTNITRMINDLARGCQLRIASNPLESIVAPTRPAGSDPFRPDTLYPHSYFARNQVVGEELMVDLMFNSTKKILLRELNFHTYGFTNRPNVMTINHVLPSAAAPAGTRDPVRGPVTMAWFDATRDGDVWANLFSGTDVNPGTTLREVYLVCDSASHLVGYYSQSPNVVANSLSIHVMFSSATFADPSPLITPTRGKNMIMPMNTVNNKYTHTYTDPIDMNRCNNIGMLPFNIRHTLVGTNVNERISHPGLGNLHFANAREETSKKNTLARMGPIINTGFMYAAQGKRMGDHQQINFVKWLYTNSNTAKTSTHTSMNPATVNTAIIPSPNLNCNHTNTYFVTTDWPAFCFSVLQRINSIIITKPKGYLVATF